jgi:hypothetical protein
MGIEAKEPQGIGSDRRDTCAADADDLRLDGGLLPNRGRGASWATQSPGSAI